MRPGTRRKVVKKRILAVVFGAGLLLSACAKNTYVGQWEGTVNVPDSKPVGGKSDPRKEMAEALAKEIGGMLKSDLELRNDMTFKITMSLMFIVNIEGSYTHEGNKLTLTPKTINGRSVAEVSNRRGADKPLILTANEDGTVLMSSEGPQGPPMIYKRKGETE